MRFINEEATAELKEAKSILLVTQIFKIKQLNCMHVYQDIIEKSSYNCLEDTDMLEAVSMDDYTIIVSSPPPHFRNIDI